MKEAAGKESRWLITVADYARDGHAALNAKGSS